LEDNSVVLLHKNRPIYVIDTGKHTWPSRTLLRLFINVLNALLHLKNKLNYFFGKKRKLQETPVYYNACLISDIELQGDWLLSDCSIVVR